MIRLLCSALACAALAAPPTPPLNVSFRTKDGWTISALYHKPGKGKPVAVLVHGAAAGKLEWNKLCAELWKLGFGTLALDLRGHGDSTAGPKGKRDFKDFDATGEWPDAVEDIASAVGFLKKRGVKSIGLIGGSIGANLVSQSRAADPSVRWLVLLSPGEDYRGVGVGDLSGRKAVAAASPGDAYAMQKAMALGTTAGGPVFLQGQGARHGAQLIDDPEFLVKLLGWLRKL